MKRTIRIIVKINPVNAPKIVNAIEELRTLGVYSDATNIIVYNDDDKELEQKIVTILDKSGVKY